MKLKKRKISIDPNQEAENLKRMIILPVTSSSQDSLSEDESTSSSTPEDDDLSDDSNNLDKLEGILRSAQKVIHQEQDGGYSDLFTVSTKDFDGLHVKEVYLPKFVMGGNKVKEKGNLYLVFDGDSSLYIKLLKLLSKGTMSKLKISLLSDEGTVETAILFPKPILSAIDFGTLEREREDERELKIEIDFDYFEIDDFHFSF